jgi:hypothetical protein
VRRPNELRAVPHVSEERTAITISISKSNVFWEVWLCSMTEIYTLTEDHIGQIIKIFTAVNITSEVLKEVTTVYTVLFSWMLLHLFW